MSITETIGQIIEPTLESLGYELVGVEYIRAKTNILRIYIDKEDGVFVDGCAIVSERISPILDVEEPINSAYHLEVSSPGVERPLFVLKHYQQFLGHTIKVELRLPLLGSNQRRIYGDIKTVYEKEEMIEIGQETGCLQVPLKNIYRANLVVDY